MTRHRAESNINVLLTRNVPFDTSVRQWSQASSFIMIPLYCLLAKLKNQNVWSIWMWRDVVLFLFWFCSFTCTVRLLFHSLLARVVEGEGGGSWFKIGRPRSRGWRKFGGRWTENRGFWKSDTFLGRHKYMLYTLDIQYAVKYILLLV